MRLTFSEKALLYSPSSSAAPIKQMGHQGFVDMESYAKVVERNPDIAQLVAEKHRTTLGGLRKLIAKGEVVPQDFTEAQFKYLEHLKHIQQGNTK